MYFTPLARLASFLIRLKIHHLQITQIINMQAQMTDIINLRHGLVNGLNAISHGKFINNLLRRFIKVHLPGFVLAKQLHTLKN